MEIRPVSSMTAGKTSWHSLPAEVRFAILEALLQDGCSLAGFAAVSREWQTVIEPHNFARIKLTPARITDFGSNIHRNRALVGYIWLCLELEEYDCTVCAAQGLEQMGMSNTDNILITTAFRDLFSTLSTWEPNGDLLLDISVHSPSDSEHWFKYLTFRPDTPADECDRNRCIEHTRLVNDDDHQLGWVAGSQNSTQTTCAIFKVFDEIMSDGPFDDNDLENQWWRQLPIVPAVTGVLLRQQNRRRWKPIALAQMFTRFPRLQEIHYEPWREWMDSQQSWTDEHYGSLFRSLASSKLQKLILFENSNPQYSQHFITLDGTPIRTPTPEVSRVVANVSLKLEHLSASFIVDASYFFHNCEPCWKWPNLTSLTLTSRLLAPDESPIEIDNMLKAAAAVAMKMPKLETMEIWNGREGLAVLFRYQSIGDERHAVITWRGTWELVLRPPVILAWEAVALEHRARTSVVVKELLNVESVIKCQGDAIHHLKLLKPVIRPISLWQIRMEHKIREGVYNW